MGAWHSIENSAQKPFQPSPVPPANRVGSRPGSSASNLLPGNDRDDLCTYECNECGHSQADVIPRTATKDSEAFGLRH